MLRKPCCRPRGRWHKHVFEEDNIMQRSNLPSIDARYWAAILIASLVGTTSGDFVSHDLNLGFVAGLLPLGALLAITLFAEHRSRTPNEAYYWTAIVITRTAATNLADLATHSLEFGYGWVAACLVALLVGTLLIGRRRVHATLVPAKSPGMQSKVLPKTDCRYWAAILTASTMGTTLGDFVSDGLKLGVGNGSLLLGAFLAAVLYALSRAKVQREAYYWVTIVIVRTTGTTMGDFLSGASGLNLGFGWAAAGTGVLLVSVLALWGKGG